MDTIPTCNKITATNTAKGKGQIFQKVVIRSTVRLLEVACAAAAADLVAVLARRGVA